MDESKSVKLLLSFDPIPDKREEYFQYIMSILLPTMEFMGLKLCDSWHTAYGEHPLRLIGFLSPDASTLDSILSSDAFKELESELQNYVINYHRRVVAVQSVFPY